MGSIFSKLSNTLSLLGGGGQTPLPPGFIGPMQPSVQGPPPEAPQESGYTKLSQQPGFSNALLRLGTTLLAANEKGMGLGEGLLAGQSGFQDELDRAAKQEALKSQAQLELGKYALEYQKYLTENALNQQKQGLEERKYSLDASKAEQDFGLRNKELGLKLKEFETKYANGGITQEEAFNRATKLRGEFLNLSKDYTIQRDAFSKIQTAAQDPSPAGDISLIYGFMKLNDPGSTVREGEYATAENAGSIPDRIRSQYNKALNGERLAANIRNDFVNKSRKLFEASDEQHQATVQQYGALAQKVGAAPDQVTVDLGMADSLKQPVIPNANDQIRTSSAPLTEAPQEIKDQISRMSQARDGQTATNPKTGQKIIMRGGQWQPL